MHSSIAIIVAVTTTVIAGPLLKRDTILIMEEVLAYPDGEIFSTAYVTTTLGTQSNPNPVTQVATSSGVLGIGDHPSSNDIAMDTAKYIEDHVDQAVKTRTGFISPIDDLFSEMALFHTNAHRINSSVPALTWDHSLADKAQIWVDLCITNEESGRPYDTGVNAAWSTSDVFNPSYFISELWYNGEFHNFPWGQGDTVSSSGPVFEGYGHLSQLLWNSTKSFGCSIKNNCGGVWKSHVVCYYSPPGNYGGEFSKVGQPSGGPTLRPNGK